MQARQAWIVVALLAAIGAAAAHTDKPHAKPAAIKKEQTDWGIAGDARAATRTIAVGMADTMRFTPQRIDVALGETIRFVVSNAGRQRHEFVIGTKAGNEQHAALMLKFPNMEHDEPYMAHVEPGRTGGIVWTFNRAGEFEFACLMAGHYQAGMVGRIVVAPAPRAGVGVGVPARLVVATQASAADMTDGEVRKVDKEGGRLTLRHGDIKGLDMPAMTMVFGVKDKALLDAVKAGDKVRFKAVNEGGRFLVIEMQVVP